MTDDGTEGMDEDKEDARPLGPGNPTRFPIVFQQGVGTGENLWFFRGVAERLREDGHVTYQAAFEVNMPAFQSPEVRATFLRDVVSKALAETGAAKVNIIAHSMGGLDARVLARMPDPTLKRRGRLRHIRRAGSADFDRLPVDERRKS